MGDLIKREDAIKAIEDLPNAYNGWSDVYDKSYIIQTIEEVPSAENKGEWIDMGDFEQCSVCKGTRLKEFQSYYGKTTWIKTPYCPDCGCRMKGASDE